MESANLHHHQHQLHQDQFVGSSSLSTPTFYATIGANHPWTPNLILNGGNLDLNVNGFLSNTRDSNQTNVDDIVVVPPSINTSMIQDFGYHWLGGNTHNFANQSAHDLHLAKIKDELSESAHQFREEYPLPSTSYTKHEGRDIQNQDEKILMNELQGGALYCNSLTSSPSFGGVPTSQLFPSGNISNPASQFLSSSGMNLQVLDLLTSTKFGGDYGQLVHNNLSLLKDAPSFEINHLKESSHWLTNGSNKISPFMNGGVADTKRSSNSVSEPKASHTASKKPRFEPRSSLAPFKVRKEKLGDRIAALQQLVAPFGKTDTASVLMEAIGYIKFLQEQVETLSVPYMKSSRNNARRSIHEGTTEDGSEETRRDLKSRGLCLVPLSCMSYIASDSIGGWPGSEFGGRN
ncbi:hypothetical protein ACHQM5_023108 [Ranunculus cassubicifolius]